MLNIRSKLPSSGSSIFSVISMLCKKYNAINLGQGYPNFDCDPALKEIISKHLSEGKNQYAPMAGIAELRSAIAFKCNTLYGCDVNPDLEITVTAGATQALFAIITAFVHQGDEVIVIEPAYDSYKPSIELAGGRVVPYRLSAPEFNIDWDKFEMLVSDATRMVIVNTPHNPTGKILSQEDMMRLNNLLAGSDIILLSDEVYEHLVFDNALHNSVLKYPDLYQRSVAVYSFGKTFHSTGWKIGYCVAPDYLMKEIRNVHQWNVFSVNSFLQYALAEYLADASSYNGLSTFYQSKRDLFSEAMLGTPLKAIKSEGTYFQLYDYSEVSNSSDMDFTKTLIEDCGVACIPVSPFYSDNSQNKVVRFCFAKTDQLLLEATEKLKQLV